MRANRILVIAASLAIVACWLPAGASAGVIDVASDPFIDYVAVDGGSVFYSKRASSNGGFPTTIHRYNIATGTDTVVRTYADMFKSPTGLAAGGGRLAITESSYSSATPGVVEATVVVTQLDGSSPAELLKQTFPVGAYGSPLGSFTLERVTRGGEAIVLVTDPQKVRNQSKLSLLGLRPEAPSTTYFATDRAPNRQIEVSDNFLVWWTLRRVGVVKLEPNGASRLRSTRRGIYSAVVDDQGRLLLTTFLGRGKRSNQLRFFASPTSDRNRVLHSASKTLPVGHFCGNRLFYTSQLPGQVARAITETDASGKSIRRLYSARPPARLNDAREFTCDAQHAAWRAIQSRGDGGPWSNTVQVADLDG